MTALGAIPRRRRQPGGPHVAMTQALYPLRFEPILKRLVWGGRKLGVRLDKPIGEGDDYAESWEISDHRADVSRVADGPLAGTSLRDLLRDRPAELLGPGLEDRGQFPLLVKFLDARESLSVQVHPDDERGRILAQDNGKTEAWVVVHAEPDGLIYCGLRPGVTREAFAAALDTGAVEPLLHRFLARAGDCLFIPAGTVHAIGAGVMMAEVQQMSDATFRVFDWDRQPPRKLHRDEALQSIDFGAGPVDPVVPDVVPTSFGTRERLARCPYFALERLRLTAPARVGQPDRFTIVMGLGGRAEVVHRCEGFGISPGQTLLLPAAIGACEIVPRGGATVLTCVVP